MMLDLCGVPMNVPQEDGSLVTEEETGAKVLRVVHDTLAKVLCHPSHDVKLADVAHGLMKSKALRAFLGTRFLVRHVAVWPLYFIVF